MQTQLNMADAGGRRFKSSLPDHLPASDLRDSVQQYLDTMTVLRKGSTANRSAQILFEYLPFATEPPRDGIIAYLAECKRRGNTNRTLSNKLVRVKAFYAAQFDLKIARKMVPRPTYIERVPEIYSADDLTTFFAACDNRQKLFFKTLLQTGMRMQEARYLEWGDLEDGFVCVRAKAHWNWIPKTSEERRIPVPKTLIAALLETKGSCSLVFSTARGNPDKHALRTCKRIAARAGLDPAKWSLHGFRRTYLTKIVNGGNLGMPTAMAIGGHKDVKSALRYQRPLEGDVLQAKIENMWV